MNYTTQMDAARKGILTKELGRWLQRNSLNRQS